MATGEPERLDPSMYVAVLLVILSGQICAADVLLPVPGLLPLLMMIIAGGLWFSLTMRRRGANRTRINQLVSLVGLVLGILLLRPFFTLGLAQGPRSLISHDLDRQMMAFLVRLIAWILAFRSWALLQNVDLLLTTGFGLSLFLLLAIIEPDALVMGCLVPFVAGSLYLFLRHRREVLRARADEVAGRLEAVSWRQDTRTLAGIGSWVAVLSLGGSLFLSGFDLPAQLSARVGQVLAARLALWLQTYAGNRGAEGSDSYMNVGDATASNSETPVFKVRATSGALWRGNVYTNYNGRFWYEEDRRSLRPQLVAERRWRVGEWEDDGRRLDRYEFTRLGDYGGPLHTVAGMRFLQVPDGRPLITIGGCAQSQIPLRQGKSYTVWAATRSGRDDRPTNVAPLTPKDHARYLRLPADLSSRVREFARQQTAKAATPEAKLNALMMWMGDHKSYTMRPRPVPQGTDAVEYFLFTMDAGWCRHFASTLAVLGRCLGIPTRLVTGYAEGESSADGEYLVKIKDAHAWVEAWLPSRGWVEYDPTSLAVERLTGLAALFDRLRFQARTLRGPALAAVLSIVVGTLTGLLAWWLARRARQPRRAPVRRRRRPHGQVLADRWLRAMVRHLGRLGVRRGPGETELALAERAVLAAPWAAAELRTLAELVSYGRFGGRAPGDTELRRAQRTLRALRRALTSRARRRPASLQSPPPVLP